jgi:hypothetical protein
VPRRTARQTRVRSRSGPTPSSPFANSPDRALSYGAIHGQSAPRTRPARGQQRVVVRTARAQIGRRPDAGRQRLLARQQPDDLGNLAPTHPRASSTPCSSRSTQPTTAATRRPWVQTRRSSLATSTTAGTGARQCAPRPGPRTASTRPVRRARSAQRPVRTGAPSAPRWSRTPRRSVQREDVAVGELTLKPRNGHRERRQPDPVAIGDQQADQDHDVAAVCPSSACNVTVAAAGLEPARRRMAASQVDERAVALTARARAREPWQARMSHTASGTACGVNAGSPGMPPRSVNGRATANAPARGEDGALGRRVARLFSGEPSYQRVETLGLLEVWHMPGVSEPREFYVGKRADQLLNDLV